MGAAVHRRTPPYKLYKRPARGVRPGHRGAARLVAWPVSGGSRAGRGRAAYAGPGGRASAGIRRCRAARRARCWPWRPAVRCRGAGDRGGLRGGADHREPQARRGARHRCQRGLPGPRGDRLRPRRGIHLAARGAVRPGARLARGTRCRLHGRGPGWLLLADLGGRRGARHGGHVRQPRGGGRARGGGSRRAADAGHRRLFRLHLDRFGASDARSALC